MRKQNISLRARVPDDFLFLTTEYSVPWDQLKDKTVLITGASGFLASYLVETLLYLNDELKMNVKVVALGRTQNSLEKKYSTYANRKDILFITQDVCFPIELDFKLDYIIHSASQASPQFYGADPVGTLSANTIGTKELLELAKKHEVDSFLYFSSAEIYGEAICTPTKETDYGFLDPLAVRSCYAESKRMGENMCIAWHHQFGVPVKIVRPFHTYGPGMKLDDGRVYADFVADAVAGRDIEVKGDGEAKRAFCYVADATAGFWMVLLLGNDAEAYNIGNPEAEISILKLAELIVNLDHSQGTSVHFKSQPHSENYLPSPITRICPDIRKVVDIGWKPVTSLESGFRKTIESYKL